MKAPFRVIEGGGLQHPHAARAHAVRSGEPLVLPPVQISHEFIFSLIGITSRQANMAFFATETTTNSQLSMLKAFSCAYDIRDRFAEALTVLRGEYLAVMMESYPAAARRIMAGKPPRRRKRNVTLAQTPSDL
jgi:hypothetical protein